jgi:hypothetical protein
MRCPDPAPPVYFHAANVTVSAAMAKVSGPASCGRCITQLRSGSKACAAGDSQASQCCGRDDNDEFHDCSEICALWRRMIRRQRDGQAAAPDLPGSPCPS